jgi:hypothetical protein
LKKKKFDYEQKFLHWYSTAQNPVQNVHKHFKEKIIPKQKIQQSDPDKNPLIP